MISLVLVAVAAGLILEFGPNEAIGFMRIKVINDTAQTVKIQPCWDIDCHSYVRLATAVVLPHHPSLVGPKWENDVPHVITVGVLAPNAETPDYKGCVVGFPAVHKVVAVFRVSQMVKCPDFAEGGGGGAG